jgi:hypothetical protein
VNIPAVQMLTGGNAQFGVTGADQMIFWSRGKGNESMIFVDVLRIPTKSPSQADGSHHEHLQHQGPPGGGPVAVITRV